MECLSINLDFKYILKDKNIPSVFDTNNLWKANEFGGFHNYEIIENYSAIEAKVVEINNQKNGLIEVIKPSFEVPIISLIFKGTRDFINTSRLEVYKQYNQISFKTINHKVNEKLIPKLIELSTVNNVEIMCNNEQVQLIGQLDNITFVETQIRVIIDAFSGLLIESFDINLSVIPILGDQNLFNFKEIVKQNNTNVYLPDLLPEVYHSRIYSDLDSFKIWITGEKPLGILNTIRILKNVIEKISFFQKTIKLSKEKLDLITLYHQDALLKIMISNSTFIKIPQFGDDDNEVTVQGNDEVSVTNTIQDIHKLTQNYYKLLINSDSFENYQQVLYKISPFKIMMKMNVEGMEVIGINTDVRSFIDQINISNILKVSLLIEINNTEKDFISGKKNGKILKILNQFNNSIIKFLPQDEYQFLVDIVIERSYNLDTLKLIMGLIEQELPSQFKFNIPEIFHKSIIGNGGLIIQSIMKKYNVYIKFSSQPKNVNLYSFKRFNNVLIKCPKKNANNIKLVETELHNLVENCGNNNLNYNYLNLNTNNSIYNSIDFKLLKSHYILLLNNFKLTHLNNLEIEFSSYINWPRLEDFDDHLKTVEVKGSDIKMKFFVNKIVECLPKNYKFQLQRFNISDSFTDEIVLPFKFNDIEILVVNNELWLSYYEYKPSEIEKLATWLKDHDYIVIERGEFEFNPVETIDELKFKKSKKPLNKITNEV
ncbi:hypothetical protein CLIB1444_05S01574 [[Candida] jaroonii]|uniref:Uncharacterized protein n=1 Tax=[Candida] jaroonii TaxID=467808 RepID=A0ACA9Y7K9_9ASCO|nr:hypothetical protein CLIB1444_05S01574 [[Candida] jaroonii]